MDARETALEQLRLRREKNAGKERVDNAKLYAGSDMFYYCVTCGEEMRLPEAHTCPVPQHCDDCLVLVCNKWIAK